MGTRSKDTTDIHQCNPIIASSEASPPSLCLSDLALYLCCIPLIDFCFLKLTTPPVRLFMQGFMSARGSLGNLEDVQLPFNSYKLGEVPHLYAKPGHSSAVPLETRQPNVSPESDLIASLRNLVPRQPLLPFDMSNISRAMCGNNMRFCCQIVICCNTFLLQCVACCRLPCFDNCTALRTKGVGDSKHC